MRQGNFKIKLGVKVSKDEAFNAIAIRKFLWNLYNMSSISLSDAPHYVMDEFNVRLTRARKVVICRSGNKKRK